MSGEFGEEPVGRHPRQAAAWIYQGFWRLLVDWFKVPQEAPTLPAESGAEVETFQPAPGFLRYMKLWFWVAAIPLMTAATIGWIVVLVVMPWVGVLLLPGLVLLVGLAALIYIGLHLHFDTTWYAMTERSLRLRRGAWIVQEMTITFENVQNVRIQQGPIQRLYGVSSLLVETAGSGGEKKQMVSNRGLIEGIEDPQRLRELILGRLRRSRGAGLGDDEDDSAGWSDAHLAVLREIRTLLAAG